MAPPTRRKLDARSLIAIAHPLRIRMRNELRLLGPATATQLAKRFGESSGSTSYHLRMLARHGFVEPDPDHKGGRERWWRAVPEVLEIGSFGSRDDPTTRDAVRLLVAEVQEQGHEHLRRWLFEEDQWSVPWRDAAQSALRVARLTPSELMSLSKELETVIARYTDRAPEPGRRNIEIQLAAFPLGEPE